MRTHTSQFKTNIKEMGREIDSRITYGNQIIDGEQLFSITPIQNTDLLKSIMKGLNFDCSVEIPLNDEINYQFGLLVNGVYEYLNYGNYIVYEREYNEDTKIWSYTCYDKMLYSMKDYESIGITYPITINNYIKSISTYLGLQFANDGQTYPNSNKIIQNELYLDSDGNTLGYTFRDVLDELSQVTASNICIDNNDNLCLKYINETNDTIDEEYLKDINVKFGEKYGPVNSIVFSRSAETDNIYMKDDESIEQNGLTEIKIKDNQILNDENRADYLLDIYNQLNGLEYYINDYNSTGIMYYELLDAYNVSIENKTYKCVMFNDEPQVNQGLIEKIYTPKPKINETDYNISSKDDRLSKKTNLIVDKVNNDIIATVQSQDELGQRINQVELLLTDQQAKIEVISTNIDDEGNVEAVKTTNGFTFDKNGLDIYTDENSYNTQIDNVGTYYKDGDTVISQTTKDGTITKDMVLYGKYYYGVDENLDVANFKKDDAMFVAQLYTDNNGEEAFGHFYNGGN